MSFLAIDFSNIEQRILAHMVSKNVASKRKTKVQKTKTTTKRVARKSPSVDKEILETVTRRAIPAGVYTGHIAWGKIAREPRRLKDALAIIETLQDNIKRLEANHAAALQQAKIDAALQAGEATSKLSERLLAILENGCKAGTFPRRVS